jgi:hypothetical protein
VDRSLCLSEKSASEPNSQAQRDFSEITFEDLSQFSQANTKLVCPILKEAFEKINGQDLNYDVERVILDGIKVLLPAVEDLLYWYMNQGCLLQLAFRGAEPVGILVYQRFFKSIIAVRILYMRPEFEKTGVGKRLVDSVDPKRIIFQTRKEAPPTRLYEVTKGRIRQLEETEKLLTWEMEWENGRT